MELHDRLEEVFRQVFDNEQLTLADEMINLMFCIEQAFAVRFTGNELADMKDIGELKRFLAGKETR